MVAFTCGITNASLYVAPCKSSGPPIWLICLDTLLKSRISSCGSGNDFWRHVVGLRLSHSFYSLVSYIGLQDV
jgi:hypothetical protein